jgi:hypothetical protein
LGGGEITHLEASGIPARLDGIVRKMENEKGVAQTTRVWNIPKMCDSLDRAEWDFNEVPTSEVRACHIWEYARESVYIRNLPLHWESLTQAHPGRSFSNLWPFLNRSKTDFPSIPWLNLKPEERKDLIGPLTEEKLIIIKGLALAEKRSPPKKSTGDGASKSETRVQRRDYVTIVLDPATWSTYTNNELGKKIAAMLPGLRPLSIAEPKNRKGDRDSRRITALRWLGAMRLMHHHSWEDIKVLANLDQEGSFFFVSPEKNNPWADRLEWMGARDLAKGELGRTFRFLPSDSIPVSYPTLLEIEAANRDTPSPAV